MPYVFYVYKWSEKVIARKFYTEVTIPHCVFVWKLHSWRLHVVNCFGGMLSTISTYAHTYNSIKNVQICVHTYVHTYVCVPKIVIANKYNEGLSGLRVHPAPAPVCAEETCLLWQLQCWCVLCSSTPNPTSSGSNNHLRVHYKLTHMICA